MYIHKHYTRILLKLTGEALLGQERYGIDHQACIKIGTFVHDLVKQGTQVAIVIGGGNIFRGIQGPKLALPRVPADHMGMLATVMNGIALQQTFEQMHMQTHVMSALNCCPIVEPYNWKQALEYLNSNKVVIFVGGTGSPYFTTDTAAALRACEIQAEIVFKATKVDGVYSKDPQKYADAVRYEQLTYPEVLVKRLDVMDPSAVALCMSASIPIFVFNLWKASRLSDILHNTTIGTIVY